MDTFSPVNEFPGKKHRQVHHGMFDDWLQIFVRAWAIQVASANQTCGECYYMLVKQ